MNIRAFFWFIIFCLLTLIIALWVFTTKSADKERACRNDPASVACQR